MRPPPRQMMNAPAGQPQSGLVLRFQGYAEIPSGRGAAAAVTAAKISCHGMPDYATGEEFPSFRLQFQRCRVDAVTQSGRAGSVLEHMAEMAAAFRAEYFGADHAVADITRLIDM